MLLLCPHCFALTLFQVGTNIQNAIETKREKSKFPIQPYLLAVGDIDNIHTWCLVLGDSHSIGLPVSTEPTRALDLLLKSFYVLNVHFPLAWKHAFRFVLAMYMGSLLKMKNYQFSLKNGWKSTVSNFESLN